MIIFEEDQLYLAILERPDEWDRYLVFSDYLAEGGDEDMARAFKWMGVRQKWAYHRRMPNRRNSPWETVAKRHSWAWYRGGNYHDEGTHLAVLPEVLFLSMCRSLYSSSSHLYFASPAKAVSRLAEGFKKLQEVLTP